MSAAPTLERRFTAAEVAEALRMNVVVLRRKAFAGEIDSEKRGRYYLFTQAHIDAYLRGDKPAPKATKAKPSRHPKYSRSK